MNGPLQRWRVMLDFGAQFKTVYVRARNADEALRLAEGLAPAQCLAVMNQISVAEDQTGPVDAAPLLSSGAFAAWDNPCPRKGW